MKTSGELKHEFYEWLDKNPDKRASDWLRLKLAEHDKGIIEMIDEMIKESKKRSPVTNNISYFTDKLTDVAYCKSLQELKQKILETKK